MERNAYIVLHTQLKSTKLELCIGKKRSRENLKAVKMDFYVSAELCPRPSWA